MDPNTEEKVTEPTLEDQIVAAVGATEEPVEPPPAEDKPAEELPNDDKPADGEPNPEDKPVEKPEDKPAEAVKPELTEDEKKVEAELKDLGITNEKSQARFRELANEARDNREYRQMYEKQQEVFSYLDKHGVTGEQFGLMTAIAGDMNSGDPTRLKRAHEALMIEVTEIGKKLGIATGGFDPLDAYPDLKAKVDSDDISREDALQWVRDKQEAKLTREHSQTTTQRTQQQTEVEKASNELNTLEIDLRAKDPTYAQKRAILEPIMRQVLPGIPPAKWASTFAEAYSKLTVAAPTPPPATRRPDPNGAQRPNSAAGASAPKSAEEAIMAQLGIAPA